MNRVKNLILLKKCAFVIFQLIAITMIGLLRTAYVSDAFTFSIIPMLLCILVVVFANDYTVFKNKKYYAWDVIFTGLFVLMLSAEEVLKIMLKMDSEIYNHIFKIVYPLALVMALLILVDYALYFSLKNKTVDGEKKGKQLNTIPNGKFLGIYYETWFVIVISYVFVIAYFPGNLNNDFDPEWIMGGHPVWSDWHTVGFAFFVRLCTLIIRKAFMVTIGQALIYYWVTNYCVSFIKRRFPERRMLSWLYVLLHSIFGFYSIMYIGAMMKDNNSAPLLLAFGVAVLDYILSKEHSRSEYIYLAIFGFLASIFRHIMFEIIIVTFICLIIGELLRNKRCGEINRKKSYKLCGTLIVIIGAYLLLTEVFAFGMLKAERNPKYISYTTPMNMAASLAYRNTAVGLPVDKEIVNMMEQVIPFDKWAEYYCPWDGDVIARPWHEIGDNVEKVNDPKVASDIIKVNIWFLKTYPVQYALSFFDLNSAVWEITCPNDLIMYCPNYASDFTNVHHMKKGAFFNFAEGIRVNSGSFATGRVLFFRGGIYLYILALTIVILFMKRRVLECVALLPIIMYAAALSISIPQANAQYIMGFSLFAVIFGIFAVVIDNSCMVESNV